MSTKQRIMPFLMEWLRSAPRDEPFTVEQALAGVTVHGGGGTVSGVRQALHRARDHRLVLGLEQPTQSVWIIRSQAPGEPPVREQEPEQQQVVFDRGKALFTVVDTPTYRRMERHAAQRKVSVGLLMEGIVRKFLADEDRKENGA